MNLFPFLQRVVVLCFLLCRERERVKSKKFENEERMLIIDLNGQQSRKRNGNNRGRSCVERLRGWGEKCCIQMRIFNNKMGIQIFIAFDQWGKSQHATIRTCVLLVVLPPSRQKKKIEIKK